MTYKEAYEGIYQIMLSGVRTFTETKENMIAYGLVADPAITNIINVYQQTAKDMEYFKRLVEASEEG